MLFLLADAATNVGHDDSGIVLLAIVAAFIASSKNRSALGWFFATLFFNWFAFILLLFQSTLKRRTT